MMLWMLEQLGLPWDEIWGHSNIEGITSALAEIIHNEARVEGAYKSIQKFIITE